MPTRTPKTVLRTNGVQNQNQDVLDLRAGSGVTLTNVDEKVTIASSGGGGTGTVTSVSETVPAEMTISGSPITTAGTLAIGWASASGNRVIASPTSGSGPYAGRILVAADIPNIAQSQVTNLVSDLALKAPLASPALTGSPTAPTQSPGDNTTKIATDAFVTAAIAAAPAPVTSVFTRTGAVVAATNDYTEAQISFSNITTNNVSITKHGYTPILPNDATKYLDGTGAYSVPPGGTRPLPVENEIVSFGTGTTGTLANTPSVISGYTQIKLYRSGARLQPGMGNDFTNSGTTVTLAVAAVSADLYIADYWM